MKNMIQSGIFLVILLICSCTRISFVHPVSEKKQIVVFKNELLGVWGQKEDSSLRIVIDSMLNYDSLPVYSIRITGDMETNFGDTSYLNGMLVNCNRKLFLELSSNLDSGYAQMLGTYNAVMIIPTFYYVRIFSVTADSLSTGQIDGEIFIHLLNAKKINFRHEFIQKDDVLILDNAESLRKKLSGLDMFPQVYEKVTYHRIQ
jgi:hypothetical protein